MAFGQDLNTAACRGTGEGSDCCSFTSAGDRSQQGTEYRASAYHLGGSFVLADSVRIFRIHVDRVYNVAASIHANGIEIEHEVAVAQGSALIYLADYQGGLGASRNRYFPGIVENILHDRSGIGSAFARRFAN